MIAKDTIDRESIEEERKGAKDRDPWQVTGEGWDCWFFSCSDCVAGEVVREPGEGGAIYSNAD